MTARQSRSTAKPKAAKEPKTTAAAERAKAEPKAATKAATAKSSKSAKSAKAAKTTGTTAKRASANAKAPDATAAAATPATGKRTGRKTAGAQKAAAPQRTCVLVLGMHRSGTSMLAGILGRLGCAHAAHLMPANFANELGYFESAEISKLNDEILKSAGSAWNDWQPVHPGWYESAVASGFHDRALEVLDEEYGSAPLIVLKDPRICRLMPFWRGVFEAKGIAPKVIHIMRNPLEVAASLAKRDGLEPDYSHLLWLRHALEAEAESRRLPRFFTSFSDVIGNWGGVTEAAGKALNIPWPRLSTRVIAEVQEFVSPNLKHFEIATDHLKNNPLLSEWSRDTYRILEGWQHGTGDVADQPRLDEIRAQLDMSVTAFAGLLESGFQRAAELTQAREDLSARQDERDAALRDKAALDARLAAESTAAQAVAERLRQTEENLSLQGATRAELERDKAELDARLQQAEENLSLQGAARAELERDKAELDARLRQTEEELTRQGAAREGLERDKAALDEALTAERSKAQAVAERLRQTEENLTRAGAAREELERDKAELDETLAAERTRAEATAARLEQVEIELIEVRSARDVARRDKTALGEKLTAETARASEAAQALVRAEAELVRAAAREGELEQLRSALSVARSDSDAISARLAVERDETEALRRVRDSLNDDLERLRADLAEKEEALSQSGSELAQRRAELDHWAQRAGELEAEQARLTRALAEKELEVEHWHFRSADLEERFARAGFEHQSERSALNQRVAELRDRLSVAAARAEDELHTLERRMGRLRTEAATELEALRHGHRAVLSDKEAELAALRGELERVRAERDIFEAGRQKLLGSTSWRMTRPLRWVVERLRR
ncbi:MAG: hypothetical protein R3D85_04015 [Paracoccaceae bacterium]